MGRRQTLALAGSQPRSALTFDQQRSVRARLMSTASAIAHQLDEYITTGKVIVAGREVRMDAARLAAYKTVLERTVPALSLTAVEHRSPMEGMGKEALVARLGEIVRARPELGERLREALGGCLVNAEESRPRVARTKE